MAAEIIDGLVKTLSKTTKEIGKATKELGARAEQGIEAQKIRNKIASEERIIEKIKVESVMSFTEDTLRVMELTVN